MFVATVNRLLHHRKTLLFGTITAVLFFQFGCVPASYESAAGTQDVNDDVHYLAAYGDWQTVAPFGMVWCPNVVSDWQPFSYGNWTWSSDGWAWVSYEPFGWLVYHYGNWYYSQGIGWFWVPGDTWSPAQVEWYSFGDYCAWAPLPPPNVFWPDPWETNGVNVWLIVNVNHLTDENVGRHRLETPVSRDIVEREGLVKRPPAVERVQLLEKRTIQPVKIEKRRVEIRPQASQAPPESVRTENPSLERMVLPQADKRKVQRNQPKVEREVLVPKSPAAPNRQEKGSPPERTKKTIIR